MSYPYNNHTWLNRNVREQIIDGYSKIIDQHILSGWKANYINFMFSHIPGSAATKMDVMKAEVTRAHDILTRHIVRNSNAKNWRHLRPVFIGSPDLPVWKQEKELVRNLMVNDGLHYNAIALTPPGPIPNIPTRLQFAFWGRHSRLKVPLKKHFEQCQQFYLNDALDRIHVTPITEGTMADYTLKAFKHGQVDSDRIEIWK